MNRKCFNNMKISIITNIPSPYRAALFDYLYKFDKNEYSIIYYSNERKELNWKKELNHHATFIRSFSISYKTKLYKKTLAIPNIFHLVSVLNNNRPDIIIASEFSISAIISFLYARLKRIKYIQWSDATLFTERNYSNIKKAIRKFVCKRANGFIASSTETKEMLISYGANAAKIYTSLIATVPKEKRVLFEKNIENIEILSVGFLSKRKGYDLLLHSIVGIDRLYKLHIIGDGEEMSNISNLVKELGLSNKVILHGRKTQEEIYSIMDNVNLFIHPSREDCFGLVVLEAMENGLPVLLSKYTGCKKDLVYEGINGFVYDPLNIKESKGIINKLINNPELLMKMGEQSKIIAEKYSLPLVAKEYIKAINSVIG